MADEVAIPAEEPNGPMAGDTEAVSCDATGDGTPAELTDRPVRAQRSALLTGLIVVVLLAGLVGWLSVRAYQAQNAEATRNLFVRTARQAAVNLNTYDYQHIDADVLRILDSATGSFYDSFTKQTQAFRDVVGQAHSRSVGTVTEAGLESQTGDEGKVLVAVSVKASDLIGGAEPRTQLSRMRITVKKMGDAAKVADVFVFAS